MNKNFINFHVLISHSPSNLNRDDMGMQKNTVFGGVKRIRISSQSLKRAIRKSEYYKDHLGKDSIRTNELEKLFDFMRSKLKGKVEDKWITKTIEFLSGKDKPKTDNKIDKNSGSNKASKPKKWEAYAVVPWSIPEFEYCAKTIQSLYENTDEKDKNKLKIEKEKKSKGKKTDEELENDFFKKKVEKELKDKKESLEKSLEQTVDIALSGRMTTSGLMTSVDGALAVAHAITTHTVDSEIDWFTAVDDLQERGAGHLDTTEFSSGVFYRYASLNLKQLCQNLGAEDDRTKALKIATHLVHLLATVTPSAKQQSFAAHNMADFVLVNFSKQPLSLANAFEEPVQSKEGLLLPSILSLLKYQKNVETAYNLKNDSKGFYFLRHCYNEKYKSDFNICMEGLEDLKSLEKLKEWVENGGRKS